MGSTGLARLLCCVRSLCELLSELAYLQAFICQSASQLALRILGIVCEPLLV